MLPGWGVKVVCVIAAAAPASARTADPQPQPAAAVSSNRHAAAPVSSTVVSDTFWSQSLGTRKRVMLWLPASYASLPQRRYPVAYYLHGAQGSESDWTTNADLHSTLDSLVAGGTPEMIVVMPDGDDGFYTTWNFLGDYAGCRRDRPANAEPADSYCVPWPHYDEYIARDLVRFIDDRYRTVADRRHRGIAGLSMGGYGAVALALAYPDVFSAAASHSGVVAPARGTSRSPVLPGTFDLEALRASYSERLWPTVLRVLGKDSTSWTSRDPGHLAARLIARRKELLPALRIDCGVDDPYLVQSRAFRDVLQGMAIPHLYVENPGSHTWDYWRRHAAESAAWLAERLAVP